MSIPTLALPRLIRKLEDALGEELCLALNDPSVVEIMLNPDGNLFVERLGRGIAHTGQMDKRAAEVAIGCVAHVLNTEVGDRKPIVSGELPLGGHRFEPMASTTLKGRRLFRYRQVRLNSRGLMPPARPARRRPAPSLSGAIRGGEGGGPIASAWRRFKQGQQQ